MLEVFPLTNFASNEPSSGYAHSYRSRRSNKKISFGAFARTNFEDFHTRNTTYSPTVLCMASNEAFSAGGQAGNPMKRLHLTLPHHLYIGSIEAFSTRAEKNGRSNERLSFAPFALNKGMDFMPTV